MSDNGLQYLDMHRSITMTVHGEAKSGKSWFGDTAPKPLLVLDAEGGSRFTPSKPKVVWNPKEDKPPEANGWETCVAFCRDYDTFDKAYQWLNSGQHHFKSVVIDSLTEIQKKLINKVAGVSQLRTQDWGDILRNLDTKVGEFRDLTTHPTNPLEAVVFITHTTVEDDKQRPLIQGSLKKKLPYATDVTAAFVTAPDQENPTQINRFLICQPIQNYVAGDRTDKLPAYIPNPNLSDILDTIYGPRPETAEEAVA